MEIDGLGVFEPQGHGGYRFFPQAKPRVFIAYAQEDLAQARRLCTDLQAAGCAPWLDKDQLVPGQNWPRAIQRAMDVSDAFVACFSERSIVKRGQFQAELRHALRCARRLPLEAVFLIPVRLEPCEVPAAIAEQVQYVDLFPDWEKGLKRILRGVRQAAKLYPPPGFHSDS